MAESESDRLRDMHARSSSPPTLSATDPRALLRWLLRWIWPSLVRYPCPGGLHCHVRHATWPLETALQLEAGWGPYLSSTEGLEALPGLPRETG